MWQRRFRRKLLRRKKALKKSKFWQAAQNTLHVHTRCIILCTLDQQTNVAASVDFSPQLYSSVNMATQTIQTGALPGTLGGKMILAGFGNPLLDLTVKIENDDLLKQYNLNRDDQKEISSEQMGELLKDISKYNNYG